MRGNDQQQTDLFSYISPEQRVPKGPPAPPNLPRWLTRFSLKLWPRFNELYSKIGRPSIPREQMLRALLTQIVHSVRSEGMLIEQLNYNPLFRWFVGLKLSHIDVLT